MHSEYGSRATAPAHIEALESRRFLSASPLAPGMDDLLHKAAVHSHATVPVLTGAAFTGTAVPNHGDHNSGLTLTITSESKTGALKGTLVVDDTGNGPTTFIITGSVNHGGRFLLHANAGNHGNAVINGSVSSDGNTLIGHYVSTNGKHHGDSGSFTVSR